MRISEIQYHPKGPYDGIYMNPNFRNYSASLTLDF